MNKYEKKGKKLKKRCPLEDCLVVFGPSIESQLENFHCCFELFYANIALELGN